MSQGGRAGRIEGPAPALSWRGEGERRLSDGESGECSLAGDLERFLEGDPDDSRLELECDIASSAAVVKGRCQEVYLT